MIGLSDTRPRSAATPWSMVLAIVLALLLGGCGQDKQPKAEGPVPLNDDQAERLAAVRFENFQAGSAVFSAAVPLDGQTVDIRGIVDWREHVGSAVLTPAVGTADLVQWSFSHLAYHPSGGGPGLPPPPPADGQWQFRSFDPSASTLDTVLAMVLNLGNDRPENAQLIRQSGARYLETATLDGAAVDVYAGPTTAEAEIESDDTSRLRYWVDGDGRLVRLEARLGGSADFVAIDIDTSDSPQVEMMPDFPNPETEPRP